MNELFRWTVAWVKYLLTFRPHPVLFCRRVFKEHPDIYCVKSGCWAKVQTKGDPCDSVCWRNYLKDVANAEEEARRMERINAERQVEQAAQALIQQTAHDGATGTKRTKREVLEFHSYDDIEGGNTTTSE